jgi:hypothetical protein
VHKLKLGPVTVNVSLKGFPSSDDLLRSEIAQKVKLLAPDVRREVVDKWANLLSQSTPRPVIRPAVGANEKGLICEIFMWEYRLKTALLTVQRNNVVLPVAHASNLSASVV